jgi:hypothetical protein
MISSSSALPVGEAGYLKAEVTFTSDLQNGLGDYIAAPMQVLWSVSNDGGDYVYTDTLSSEAGSEWNGVSHPIYATITDLDPSTGAGEAIISIPIGIHTPAGTRFPLLPDGTANVDVHVGWRGVIQLNSSGQPTGVLGSAEASFDTAWPDVWVGSMNPPPEFADPEYLCHLMLKSPASAARTFTIASRPSGIATVLDTTVVVPQGDLYATIRLHVDNGGTFALRAKEGGVTVADSPLLEVSGPLVLAVEGTNFFSSPELESEYTSFVDVEPETHIFKECNPATISDPGVNPTVELCGACGPGAAAGPCVGEAAGTDVGAWAGATCSIAVDMCNIVVKEVTKPTYQFASKKSVECGWLSHTVSTLPFGMGHSYTTVEKLFQTCCTYTGTSSSPSLPFDITDCGD